MCAIEQSPDEQDGIVAAGVVFPPKLTSEVLRPGIAKTDPGLFLPVRETNRDEADYQAGFMCGSARNVICKKQTVGCSLPSCIAIRHCMTEDFHNHFLIQ